MCAQTFTHAYLGISEASTLILVVLANFDDRLGIEGLGSAFPTTKILLGVAFAILFILVRVVLWPYFAYYVISDIHLAFTSYDREMAAAKTPSSLSSLGGVNGPMHSYWRRMYFRFVYVSLSLLTVLQMVFLAQIMIQGKQEIEKFLGGQVVQHCDIRTSKHSNISSSNR